MSHECRSRGRGISCSPGRRVAWPKNACRSDWNWRFETDGFAVLPDKNRQQVGHAGKLF
jgi:hypothetical protein